MTLIELLRVDPTRTWLAVEIAESLRRKLVDVYAELVELGGAGMARVPIGWRDGRSHGWWEAMRRDTTSTPTTKPRTTTACAVPNGAATAEPSMPGTWRMRGGLGWRCRPFINPWLRLTAAKRGQHERDEKVLRLLRRWRRILRIPVLWDCSAHAQRGWWLDR